MRPSLHILSDRRRHQSATVPARRPSGTSHTRADVETQTMAVRPALRRRADQVRLDLDAQRVRESGGPLDLALYNCACGYVFDAAVSTTVACPHCGDNQAW